MSDRWAPPKPTTPVVTTRSPGRAPSRVGIRPGPAHPTDTPITDRVSLGFVSPPRTWQPNRAAIRSAPRRTERAHRLGVPAGTSRSISTAAGRPPFAAMSLKFTAVAAAPIRAAGLLRRKWTFSMSASEERSTVRCRPTDTAAASSPIGSWPTWPAGRCARTHRWNSRSPSTVRPPRVLGMRYLYGKKSFPSSSRPRMIRMILSPPSAPTMYDMMPRKPSSRPTSFV